MSHISERTKPTDQLEVYINDLKTVLRQLHSLRQPSHAFLIGESRWSFPLDEQSILIVEARVEVNVETGVSVRDLFQLLAGAPSGWRLRRDPHHCSRGDQEHACFKSKHSDHILSLTIHREDRCYPSAASTSAARTREGRIHAADARKEVGTKDMLEEPVRKESASSLHEGMRKVVLPKPLWVFKEKTLESKTLAT